MKSICYIQARAGSKRFPGKNRADWYGEPLYRVAYDTAVQSGLFAFVTVYSDDMVIDWDADIMRIPRGVSASDGATDDDVAREFVPYLMQYDGACKLYPTTPLLTASTLVAAYQQWQRDGGTGIRAVAEYEHPPERSMRFLGAFLEWDNPEYAQNSRLYERYYDCGAFQFFDVQAFLKHGTLNMPNMGGYVLNWWEHQDINYPGDLDKARAKHEWRQQCSDGR